VLGDIGASQPCAEHSHAPQTASQPCAAHNHVLQTTMRLKQPCASLVLLLVVTGRGGPRAALDAWLELLRVPVRE
jgi:hypothetical protein